MKYSVTVNNARLDAVETAIGAGPKVELRSGPVEANCAAASAGTLLANGTLPADWLAAAVAGVKAKAGTWTLTGSKTGTLGHFRIFDSTGVTCHLQGSITLTGLGGDLTVDNLSIAPAQVVNVTGFTITAGNA